MGIKKAIVNFAARRNQANIRYNASRALEHQEEWMHALLKKASATVYGRIHAFDKVRRYQDFIQNIPLVNYHALEPFIQRVRQGEKNILWPGLPLYMAKTSGTTGDFKYLPISHEAMPYHITAARHCLLQYILTSGNTSLTDGKMLFLQGSPQLEIINGIKTGRLSGIVANHIPIYLRANRLPTYETNCIPDWNRKVNAIIEETLNADMRLFGGIPSWLIHYLEELLKKSGKSTLSEIYPNLKVLMLGGTGYQHFENRFRKLLGKNIDILEVYPATEGFIAWSDDYRENGMLLNTNAGMFFEFIPANELNKPNPSRIWLKDVEPGVNYAIALSTNAGLFGYVLGDTVKFLSRDPYRLIVTGRTKEYVSAFGEQVYAHQTDSALQKTLAEFGVSAGEYHVYPEMNSTRPHHVWMIEFEKEPENLKEFEKQLDKNMHEQNIYYRDIVLSGVIGSLKINAVPKNGFYRLMEKKGKLGEQNKMPKLSNDDAFVK